MDKGMLRKNYTSVLEPNQMIRDLVTDHPDVFSPVNAAEKAITARFDALGGEATLGRPIEVVRGLVRYFADSVIVYNAKQKAAYGIHGPIYRRWREAGGLAYGTPSTDETAT